MSDSPRPSQPSSQRDRPPPHAPGTRAPGLLAGRPGRLYAGAAVLAVVLVLAGIAFLVGSRTPRTDTGAGAGGNPGADGGAAPGEGRFVYLLQPSSGAASRVSLEVAAGELARRQGLSRRTDVPAGTGMVFIFPRDTTVPFWMKDTLVPLQIAFVAADGRVVGTFEMPPCLADKCPTFAPRQPYRYAVELRSGAFTAAGVREGDRVVPRDPSALPKAS
jgi:uncharacterized protein